MDALLDRFLRRFPRFGIPHLMTIVIIGMAVVYIMDLFSSSSFSSMLFFYSPYILQLGQVWRLVTFVFIPQNSNIFFMLISLYFYWMIGNNLEREWGCGKFTAFYCIGIILNIIMGFIIGTANMYYVNLSMFVALATLYPNMQFLLFFFIPIKAKWLALVDVAFIAFGVITDLVGGSALSLLMIVPALLNYLLFFSGDILRFFRRQQRKANPNVVNFKRARKKAQAAQETKGYTHKCAVCGITDQDDPNMEFRYCSKCNGYYCYCMNHIYNHVHIK
ncbi:MAG: rhomboid family intramembrane serine protease [Oscillospiraceae bacterium]|nr:rhomboid family intramembrane serine protease [Oscillospiraceae bacterium]